WSTIGSTKGGTLPKLGLATAFGDRKALRHWVLVISASVAAHGVVLLILARLFLAPTHPVQVTAIPIELVTPEEKPAAPASSGAAPSTLKEQATPQKRTGAQGKSAAETGSGPGVAALWSIVCMPLEIGTRIDLGRPDCEPYLRPLTEAQKRAANGRYDNAMA